MKIDEIEGRSAVAFVLPETAVEQNAFYRALPFPNSLVHWVKYYGERLLFGPDHELKPELVRIRTLCDVSSVALKHSLDYKDEALASSSKAIHTAIDKHLSKHPLPLGLTKGDIKH